MNKLAIVAMISGVTAMVLTMIIDWLHAFLKIETPLWFRIWQDIIIVLIGVVFGNSVYALFK